MDERQEPATSEARGKRGVVSYQGDSPIAPIRQLKVVVDVSSVVVVTDSSALLVLPVCGQLGGLLYDRILPDYGARPIHGLGHGGGEALRR